MNNLRIGTCSWKYDSWKNIFYPDVDKINYLKEFSQKLNTVEIDQWFWALGKNNLVSLPKYQTVMAYKASVPKNFKFTIKLPNALTLTHHYRKKKSDLLIQNPNFLSQELMEQFLISIDPIKNNLGPLMFQFEYLNKEKMSSIDMFIDQFSEFISKCPKNFQYGIEIRNPNYLTVDYFNFLNENNLSHVFLQGYFMPSIFDVFNKFHSYLTNTTVIRLHGDDRTGIEKRSGEIWNKILDNRDEEIEQLIFMLNQLSKNEIDTYLNVNNHYEGSAPLTILKIQKKLAI